MKCIYIFKVIIIKKSPSNASWLTGCLWQWNFTGFHMSLGAIFDLKAMVNQWIMT